VLPRLLTVQVWNIETDRAEDIHNVLLVQHTWAELEGLVRQAFCSRWTAENKGRFALYYLHDLLQPLETRADVSNQQQLEGYLTFLAKPPRDRGLMLFLNVAVIFQASGKPLSPVKAPLIIDTELARTSDSRPAARQRRSPSQHLSPDAPGSPQSPSTPRQAEFRQMVLARDSDGCVRPDVALLQSPPPAIFRCVFCEKLLLPHKRQIEAAHVIPHSADERFELELSNQLLLLIGGLEHFGNGVSACSICHGEFDNGLLWVDVQAADGTQLIHVHESLREVVDFAPLHSKPVRKPAHPEFPFPGAAAWAWRKKWAAAKRERDAEQLRLKLAEMELGSARVLCGCGGGDINKKCRSGPNKSPLCKQCCELTQKVCAPHKHTATGSTASASAASPAST